MRTKFINSLSLSAVFAFSLLATAGEAQAANAVPKGTFKLGAERLAGFGVTFGPGDPFFATGLFVGNAAELQFPRVGADFFIIDGLSLGGTLGLAYRGDSNVFMGIVLPRVGYAFALSPSIDFWPRGGIGIRGTDPGGSAAILDFEGAFIWNINPVVGLEFGPALDANLDTGSVTLAGNAGLVATF